MLEFTCKRHTKDNIDNTQHVSQQKRIIQNMKMEKNHDKNYKWTKDIKISNQNHSELI